MRRDDRSASSFSCPVCPCRRFCPCFRLIDFLIIAAAFHIFAAVRVADVAPIRSASAAFKGTVFVFDFYVGHDTLRLDGTVV